LRQKRARKEGDMTTSETSSLRVVLAAYSNLGSAQEALHDLSGAVKSQQVALKDIALLGKNPEGKFRIVEAVEKEYGEGRYLGSASSAAMNALIRMGWSQNGGAGGAEVYQDRPGFSFDLLREMVAHLAPESRALLAVVEEESLGDIQQIFEGRGGRIVTEELNPKRAN
jgi:hypothetical protein